MIGPGFTLDDVQQAVAHFTARRAFGELRISVQAGVIRQIAVTETLRRDGPPRAPCDREPTRAAPPTRPPEAHP